MRDVEITLDLLIDSDPLIMANFNLYVRYRTEHSVLYNYTETTSFIQQADWLLNFG